MQKVCVIGLGYIGLPLASVLANNGYQVHGVDIREDILAKIRKGGGHLKEPGLENLVLSALDTGNLTVSAHPRQSDVFIIAVQTPLTKTKTADLSYVKNAVKSITKVLEKGNTVIVESTVPPGTLADVITPLLDEAGFKAGENIYLAYSPERVLPGAILKELVEDDRVIGGINKKSARKAKALYESFVQGDIYLTDATTAELAKLAENTFRDANIALANELAKVCSNVGTNVWEVIELANRHPRVNLHLPGPGVGGHCLTSDPYFLVSNTLNKNGLIVKARSVNEEMPKLVVTEVENLLKDIEDPIVSIFGVAYKGNVDDTRDSPALEIIKQLEKRGIKTKAYDPCVDNFSRPLFNLEETVKNSDCILITADHSEFEKLDIERIAPLTRHRLIVDTKHCISSVKWRESGFIVYELGVGVKNLT